MKSANRLEMLTIIEYAGEHRLELLAAARRRLDLEAGPEQRARARCCASAIVRPGLSAEIDAIERAAAAEHLLRGVDVHDREVAAERARQPRRLHDAADGELLLALDGAERQPAADRQLVPVGELPRQRSSSRAAPGTPADRR